MMSKAILTIEPAPESCGTCPIRNYYRGSHYCIGATLLANDYDETYPRPNCCPLEFIESEETFDE